MKQLTVNLNMVGNGYVQQGIPSGYRFMSIINTSENIIEVYRGAVTNRTQAPLYLTVPLNTMITTPLTNDTQFTFIYRETKASKEVKLAQVLFTTENLNINGSIGTSSFNGDISIKADTVGMAKQSQLPSSLHPSGSLRTAIVTELPAGTNTIGTVKIDGQSRFTLENSLPAGTNKIGRVEVEGLNTAQAMTQTPLTTQLKVKPKAAPLRVGDKDASGRKQIVIYNMDAEGTVYIGGDSVTDTTGFPLLPGASVALDQNPASAATVYGVSTIENGVPVAVMEVC